MNSTARRRLARKQAHPDYVVQAVMPDQSYVEGDGARHESFVEVRATQLPTLMVAPFMGKVDGTLGAAIRAARNNRIARLVSNG